MKNKEILFGDEAQKKLLSGLKKTADAVKSTLGPKGKNVLIQTGGSYQFTKDGITVAKSIEFSDHFENMGAQIAKEAGGRSVKEAGDGPQPKYAKVLTPNGFVQLGSLKVGDTICGTNGTFQKVLGVFDKGEREIVQVHMADGRMVECCDEHLFTVIDGHGKERTVTVHTMMNERGMDFAIASSAYEQNPIKLKKSAYQMGFDATDDADALKEGFAILMGSKAQREEFQKGMQTAFATNKKIKNIRAIGDIIHPLVSSLSGGENTKIAMIAKTGKTTPMMCIKVSNPDHLYFTDGFVLTHNTTSTITLLDAIAQAGARHKSLGVDAMNIRRGIDLAAAKVVEFVKKEAVPVDGIEDLRRVATISANGDEEIGNIIAETLHQAGADATVTLEEGRGTKKTRVELTKGFEFDRGMLSELFMNDVPKQRTIYNEPVVDNVLAKIDPRFGNPEDPRAAYVWVVNGRLGSMADEAYMKGFMGVINLAHSTNVPLIVIAEAIESDSLQTLLSAYHNQKYPVVAIKAPGFGADRRDLMFDMAAFTGATVRRPETDEGLFENFSLAEFGTLKSVTVGIEKTVMIAPDEQAEAIEQRVEEIDAKLSVTTEGDFAHTLTRRKSMLTGGVANIIIGGNSEAEVRERRDLFEDALLAARAAAMGGIVPGAGTVLVRASKMLSKFKTGNQDQDVGVHILREALLVPFQEIIKNGASVSAEVALEKIQGHRDPHYGYDSSKEEYCNLIKRGIVDPARVIISEVEHASSMAGLLLSTNVVIGFEQSSDMEKAMGGLLRGGR